MVAFKLKMILLGTNWKQLMTSGNLKTVWKCLVLVNNIFSPTHNIDQFSTSDLSNNNLDDPEVLEVLSRMPELHVLNLMGNPILRKTIDYRYWCKMMLNYYKAFDRRNMINKCKGLTYLDSRPVSDRDRICIEAWAKVTKKSTLMIWIFALWFILINCFSSSRFSFHTHFSKHYVTL